MFKATLAVVFVLLSVVPVIVESSARTGGWRQFLQEQLPIFGHRNWIVVSDSAYPAQTSAGVVTIDTGEPQIDVLKEVVKQLNQSKHVTPIIYVDAELGSLTDHLAPGIEQYKKELYGLLEGMSIHETLHEDLIAKLDESGKTFKVVVLKSTMTMPYTSVFAQLDCKYWGAEQEKLLREIMKK